MSEIVSALSWGASAFVKGVLSGAAKDAYEALKDAVLRIASSSDVENLEHAPNSAARRGVIAEGLEKAGKAEDPELARLACALIVELKDVNAIGGATGISLEDVQAVNVRLQRIRASGTGVSIGKSKFTGDIEVSDVLAGVKPQAKPDRQ